MSRAGSIFRGSELSRLLVLFGVMVAGWAVVLVYATRRPAPALQKPPPAVSAPLPPPDTSPPFTEVRDRAVLTAKETPAYAALLARTRSTPPAQLAAQGRRDVVFSQLLGRPERYRGLPIHLEGTARRVLVHDELDAKLAPGGRLYEAWVFTPDSQQFPYVLVFEEPPKGLPGGDDVFERVAFNGYFFKLLAYLAGDKPRVAPMLVGRLSWFPQSDAASANSPNWMLWLLAVPAVYALLRLGFILRRAFVPPPPRPSRKALMPTDEIAPEDLAAWLDHGPDDTD